MSNGITVPSKDVRDAIGRKSGKYSNFTRQLDYIGIYSTASGVPKLYWNTQELSHGPSSAANDNVSPEYYFKLPPRSYEVTDPFATSVTPTQNNSKFVERYGVLTREVRLSGTTGLRPSKNFVNKSLKLFGFDTGLKGPVADVAEFAGLGHTPDVGGSLKALVDVFAQPSPWQDGEALGYDDIIFLRNLFRLYAWLQTQETQAGSHVMIWRNIRDGEYWFVEPTEFKLSRDKSSPMTYEYSISMKLIAPYDYTVKLDKDTSLLNSLREFSVRVDQAINTIRQAFVFTSLQVNRFARLPLTLANAILTPMNEVLSGAESLIRSVASFKSTFKASCRKMVDSCKNFLDRVSHLLDPQDPVIYAIRKAKRAGERILTDPQLQPDDTASRIRNALSPASSSATVTSPAPGSARSPNSHVDAVGSVSTSTIKAADVFPNDNIHTLATRLLGHPGKFPILVAANSLNPPYISKSGGIGVLKPGDKILYPEATNLTSKVNNTGNLTQKSVNDTIYGTDLKLYPSSKTGKLDLALSQTGSVALVSGVDNVVQAITLKFATENGELPRHPQYGAAARIGSKATPATLAGIRLDTEHTLMSDPRVAGISSLNFVAKEDVLFTSAKINIVGTTDVLNVSLPLRS